MGCDMHAYIERQDAAGQWRPVPVAMPYAGPYKLVEGPAAMIRGMYEQPIERYYLWFAHLAGARNYHGMVQQPVAAHRGLPADVSPEVQIAHAVWREDAHHTSWATPAECVAAWTACDAAEPLSATGLEPMEPTDRLVFWFDN